QSANELVHPSVHQLLAADTGSPRYDPPNLWAYKKAHGQAAIKPEHRYLDGVKSTLFLAVWLGAIAYAGWWLGVRLHEHGAWLAALALLALALDWSESNCNHRVALEPDGPRAEARRVLLEAFLYLRLLLLP